MYRASAMGLKIILVVAPHQLPVLQVLKQKQKLCVAKLY